MKIGPSEREWLFIVTFFLIGIGAVIGAVGYGLWEFIKWLI